MKQVLLTEELPEETIKQIAESKMDELHQASDSVWVLSPKAFEAFVKACEEPGEPTEALKRLMRGES